jgi:hypothetical protein
MGIEQGRVYDSGPPTPAPGPITRRVPLDYAQHPRGTPVRVQHEKPGKPPCQRNINMRRDKPTLTAVLPLGASKNGSGRSRPNAKVQWIPRVESFMDSRRRMSQWAAKVPFLGFRDALRPVPRVVGTAPTVHAEAACFAARARNA